MATDIYSMLTGGSNDPFGDQLNRQQEAFQQRLMQSTDPRSFIATVGGNMGAQLGAGAGRLLTGGTPEEKKNRLKQEAMAEVQASGVDLSDQVAVLKAIMTALQKRGLTAEAMAVGSQMPKPEKTQLSNLGRLLTEQAKYEAGTPGFIAYQNAIDKETAAAASKDPSVGPKAELISQSKYNKPFAALTATEKAEVYKMVEASEKNSLGAGLNAFAEALIKGTGKGVGEDVADAVSPVVLQGKENTLAALKRAETILNEGIYTGGLANLKMAGAKYTPLGSQEKLERTEKYLAYVSTTVIPLLKEFGGNDSNEELKFLQRLVGGEITLEEGTLKEIIASAITKTQRAISRAQASAASAAKGEMPSTEVRPQNLGAQPTPLDVGGTTTVNGVVIKRVK